MEKFIVFGILTIPNVIVSRRILFNVKAHGFYRFLAWECILWLAINNYKFWFNNPFSLKQILSWLLLCYSLMLFVPGTILLIKIGKPHESRVDKVLYKIEKTTKNVSCTLVNHIENI